MKGSISIFSFLLLVTLLSAQDLGPCFPGQVPSIESGCVDCLSGTFDAGDICESCPRGTFQPQERSETCLPCVIGRYQDEIGQVNCKDCPPGTTTMGIGSDSISACIPVEETPVMPRWGLFLLGVTVLATGFFLFRRTKLI